MCIWIVDSTGKVCLHNVCFCSLLSVLADISPYKSSNIEMVNKSVTAIVFWIQYLIEFHLKLASNSWVNMYRKTHPFAHFYTVCYILYLLFLLQWNLTVCKGVGREHFKSCSNASCQSAQKYSAGICRRPAQGSVHCLDIRSGWAKI